MTPVERLVADAMLDVAVERLTTFHPGCQIFIFGPDGDPFWAHYQPDERELVVLELATKHLEQKENAVAPLSFTGSTGLYTAYVLDAEHTLFAVVLARKGPRPPAEAKVSRAPRTEDAPPPARRRSSSALP